MKLRYILLVFFLLSSICVFGCWQLLPASPIEPLTTAQLQCVEQVANQKSLVYADVQDDEQFIAIGYEYDDKLHAVLLIMHEEGDCLVEFHEVVGERHFLEYGDRWVMPSFMRFGAEDLTGNQIPEIYIGLRSNFGRHQGEYRLYSKQSDESYQQIGRRYFLCDYRHSFEIINKTGISQPVIFISDDILCNDFFGLKLKPKYFTTLNEEYIINNNNFELINYWRGTPDGEIKCHRKAGMVECD